MIDVNRIGFDESSHTYTLDGRELKSVTQILEAEGLSGCGFWKEEHRDRGTAVHKIALLITKRPWRGSTVEEIVANSRWDPSTTHPQLIGYGYAVAKFLLETGFRPDYVEQRVASEIWRICGTFDASGLLPSGQRLLPDYKSGEPQESAWVQTALYAMCKKETLGIDTDLRTPVWLKPDGSYKIYPMRPAGGADLMIGQSAINLYRWRERNGMLG